MICKKCRVKMNKKVFYIEDVALQGYICKKCSRISLNISDISKYHERKKKENAEKQVIC